MLVTLTITNEKELRILVINLINKIISKSDQPIRVGSEGHEYLMTEFKRVIQKKEWNRHIYFIDDKEKEDIFAVAKDVIDWAMLQNENKYKKAGGM